MYQYFLSLDIIFHSLSSLIIPQLFSVFRANSSMSFSCNMNQLLCCVALSLDLFLFLSISFLSTSLFVRLHPIIIKFFSDVFKSYLFKVLYSCLFI